MKGDTIGSTDLHLVCGDRLLVGAVHADMEINEYSSRKGVYNHTLQVGCHGKSWLKNVCFWGVFFIVYQ